MALTPARSAIIASSGAFLLASSQPRRNFSVTGLVVAPTAATIRRSASRGSRIRAEPHSAPVTSFAGQPMLRSTISAPAASAIAAPLAIHFASRPTNCTTISGRPSPTAARLTTSGRPRASISQATISVATYGAPSFDAARRNGRSEIPVMGAESTQPETRTSPIWKGEYGAVPMRAIARSCCGLLQGPARHTHRGTGNPHETEQLEI